MAPAIRGRGLASCAARLLSACDRGFEMSLSSMCGMCGSGADELNAPSCTRIRPEYWQRASFWRIYAKEVVFHYVNRFTCSYVFNHARQACRMAACLA